MKEYIYRKIFCTGNKAFWSITLGKFLQKQIIINTNHNVKKKSSSETKNQFKSRSMQKIPLTPMKLTEDRWISPKHNRVSLSRATVLLLKGPWCTSISNMAAYPSETLIRSSGGPSIKKGVGNSIQITQALRSRGLQGRCNPFLFYPPPQVFLLLIFPVTVSYTCNWKMFIPFSSFFKEFGKVIYEENPPCGEGYLISSKTTLFD